MHTEYSIERINYIEYFNGFLFEGKKLNPHHQPKFRYVTMYSPTVVEEFSMRIHNPETKLITNLDFNLYLN